MPLATLRFEPLAEEHLPAILAIEAEVNSAPWSEKSFRNEISHPNGVFRVGLLQGEVVAYAGAWIIVDEAHITTVAVAPSLQRHGIGRRLIREVLAEAKERGVGCSTLEVRAGNQAAIKLYENLGFEVAARRRAYYPDNKEDALVMWLYSIDILA